MSYIDTYCQIVGTPAFEGTVPWLYLDSEGYPTTGCGFLVATLDASYEYPWWSPDGTPASLGEIADDWMRVKALPADRLAKFYTSPTALTLTSAAILDITRTKVEMFDQYLTHDYPGYTAFPDAVKMALLDMEYNLGDVKLRKQYPRFDAAVDAQDWTAAAAECGRNVSQPAFDARNAWTKEQFLSVQL
jgi:GH24 family phage-related lysozyme (muramidase)